MNSSALVLRNLQIEDEKSFKQAVDAFKNERPPWDFAFDFDENGNFSDYVEKLEAWSRGERTPEKFVQNSYYVGVVDGIVVGRLSLRHCLNDFLEKVGGHIGYGVIPTCRRKGYATAMLNQAIPISASLGIEKALKILLFAFEG